MFSISWQVKSDEAFEVIGTRTSIDCLYWILKTNPNCIYVYCRETISGRNYTPQPDADHLGLD